MSRTAAPSLPSAPTLHASALLEVARAIAPADDASAVSFKPHPAQPGELRWYARIDDKEIEVADRSPLLHEGEVILPASRTFISARLADNPVLMMTRSPGSINVVMSSRTGR